MIIQFKQEGKKNSVSINFKTLRCKWHTDNLRYVAETNGNVLGFVDDLLDLIVSDYKLEFNLPATDEQIAKIRQEIINFYSENI